MQLSSQDLQHAERLVRLAGNAQEFRRAREGWWVEWWKASPTQVTQLKAATQRPDVKDVIDGYCKPITLSTGFDVLTKMPPIQKNGRDGWFQYYLTESKTRGVSNLTQPEKNRMLECFQSLLYKRGRGPQDWALKADFNEIP